MSVEQVASLLRPSSIAIVGATEDLSKIVGRLLPVLIDGGYGGQIFPVNPKYRTVRDLTCYPTLLDIPFAVDHCIVALPRSRVAEILQQCRKKGVRGASIYSSGYAEAGADGKEAQAELKALAGDMIFIGPNCMGFANLGDKVLATASSVIHHDPTPGDVALLTQSGGLGLATFGYLANEAGLHFSYAVNTGNSAGVSFADLTEFLFDDAATRVIVAIAEDDRTVAEIVTAVRRRGLVKPIILLKLGRGETGQRMAASHTGALAGDYRLMRDVAEQHGIICTDDLEEAVGTTQLARQGFSAADAGAIAAMSVSGGNVTQFADQVDIAGLAFAKLAESTCARLSDALPGYVNVNNPVDLTSFASEDPSIHVTVGDILLDDPATRLLVPILTTMPDYVPVCRMLAEFKARRGRPIAVLWTGGAYEQKSRPILDEADIPVFRSASVLARCVKQLRNAHRPARQDAPSGHAVAPLLPNRQGELTEAQSMHILGENGIKVPRHVLVERHDLGRAVDAFGYPVVIKSDLAETHLSDRGGVIAGLKGSADLQRERDRIAAMPGDRFIVSEYLPGHELFASVFVHPSFGPVLTVGSGGILVEVLHDVRFVALPASTEDIAHALQSTALGKAMKIGHRSIKGFEAAVTYLKTLADFALSAGARIKQIELNPITVGAHGVAAVDASIILS